MWLTVWGVCLLPWQQFYAPWCTFCKQLDPVWHQIGSELRSLGSAVNVGKCDGTSNTGKFTAGRSFHGDNNLTRHSAFMETEVYGLMGQWCFLFVFLCRFDQRVQSPRLPSNPHVSDITIISPLYYVMSCHVCHVMLCYVVFSGWKKMWNITI